MGSEWPRSTLGDLIESNRAHLQTGPFGTALKSSEYSENGVPLISVREIRYGHIEIGAETPRVDEQTLLRLPKFILKKGDIVFGRKGGTDRNAIIKERETGWFLGSDGIRLRLDNSVDHLFFSYQMRGPTIKNWLVANSEGTTMPSLNQKVLGRIPLILPPIKDQSAIAHILGSLDDKIELNRQMNETLEAMAQALFKSWFVDFDPVIDNALAAGNDIPEALASKAAARQALGDARKPLPEDIRQHFPSRFKFTEEMGWIPEGWEVKPLDTLINLIGGGTPKTSIEEYWNGTTPWFSVVDAPNPSDIFVIDTEKHVTQIGIENSSTKILPVGTTIISARGTIGKCAMVAKPMAMNQSCYGVRGKENISDSFIYYTIYLRVADLQQRSHGSVFSTITRDTFKTIQIPFSGVVLTNKFEGQARSLFQRILENSHQASTLSKLRDTLLPKLLSGEIRIPDAEKLIEEAVA